MSDDEADETVEFSVTMPRKWVYDELMPEYPAATRPSQALRMAAQNDVQRKQQKITPSAIRDSVIEALERSGGVWENIQRIEVNSVEDIEITETDGITIEKTDTVEADPDE